jgi:hypothetical protein
MPVTSPKAETDIVVTFDYDTGMLDVRVFAAQPNSRRPQPVGTATLRMQDVADVAALLTERAHIHTRRWRPSFRATWKQIPTRFRTKCGREP